MGGINPAGAPSLREKKVKQSSRFVCLDTEYLSVYGPLLKVHFEYPYSILDPWCLLSHRNYYIFPTSLA